MPYSLERWFKMWIGKDIAKTQFKSYEIGFNEVEDEEPLCECGEHKSCLL